MTESAPKFSYWHLWVDEGGTSRQTRRTASDLTLKDVAEGAAPVWASDPIEGARRTVLAALPAHVVGEWHENPVPQWIVVLSGRWFVESMDGTRVEMGAGELSLGTDQGTREVDGRRGHRSGAVGPQPCRLLLVQYDTEAAAAWAGRI